MNQELLNKTLANECSRCGWSYDQIGLLVELGADVNALTSNSKSPEVKPILFMIESASNQRTLLRRLLELGVKIEIEGIEAFFGRVIFENISCDFLIELARKYASQMSIDFLLRMAVVSGRNDWKPDLCYDRVVCFIIAGAKSSTLTTEDIQGTDIEILTALVSKNVDRKGYCTSSCRNVYLRLDEISLDTFREYYTVKLLRALHETSPSVKILSRIPSEITIRVVNEVLKSYKKEYTDTAIEFIEWLFTSLRSDKDRNIGQVWNNISLWNLNLTWEFYKLWCRLDLGGYINILHSFLGYIPNYHPNPERSFYFKRGDNRHFFGKFHPLNYEFCRLSRQMDLFDPLIRILNDPYHPDHYSIAMNPTVHYPYLIPPHQKVIKTIMTFHSLNLSLFAILPKELLYEIMSWIIYADENTHPYLS